jgi:benzodiazapine receptor
LLREGKIRVIIILQTLMQTKTQHYTAVLAAFLFPALTAAFGSYFTSISVTTWYLTLEQPWFSPPSAVFGPVWTLLYISMGISFYFMLTSQTTKEHHYIAIQFFFLQLVMNAAWSLAFFALMNPLLALIGIIALDLLVLGTIIAFYRINKTAAYLLIPYYLWILFATILNASIVSLAM